MSGANLLPFALYGVAVLLLAVAILAITHFTGERHAQRATGEPYESGIVPTGSARLRLSVKFYLVAVFFVIFDLEAVFIFAWAVALREAGWRGYGGMAVFIAAFLAALVYLVRQGALEWRNTSPRLPPQERQT